MSFEFSALDEVEDGGGGFFPDEGVCGGDDGVLVVAAVEGSAAAEAAGGDEHGVEFGSDAQVGENDCHGNCHQEDRDRPDRRNAEGDDAENDN